MDQAHSDSQSDQATKVAGAPVEGKKPEQAAPASQALTGQPTRIIQDDSSHKAQDLPPAPAVAKGEGAGVAISEAESLRAELESIKAELESTKAGKAEELDKRVEELSAKVALQKEAALQRVLKSMGVKEHLRKYAPQVDVDTQEGRQKLQKWAQENPELVGSGLAEEAPTFSPDQLREKFKSPHLVNIEMLRGKKP